MPVVQCPSCGHPVDVPKQKQTGIFILLGCGLAAVAIPIIVAFIGLLAAIAIPAFIKARSTAMKHACVNNMRIIDAAKDEWSLENRTDVGATVDPTVINEYFNSTPICPKQGEYIYHNVGNDPECTVHGLLSAPTDGLRSSQPRAPVRNSY